MRMHNVIGIPVLVVGAVGLAGCLGGSSSSGSGSGDGGGGSSSISAENERELVSFAHEFADMAGDFADMAGDAGSGLGDMSTSAVVDELSVRTLERLDSQGVTAQQTDFCDSGSFTMTELAGGGFDVHYDACRVDGMFGFFADGRMRYRELGARDGYPSSFEFDTMGTTLHTRVNFEGNEFEFRMRGTMDGWGNVWNHARHRMNLEEFSSSTTCDGSTESFRGRMTPIDVRIDPAGSGGWMTVTGDMAFAEGGEAMQAFTVTTIDPVHYASAGDQRPHPGSIRLEAGDGTFLVITYDQGGVWVDINGDSTFYTWPEFQAEFVDHDDFVDDCI